MAESIEAYSRRAPKPEVLDALLHRTTLRHRAASTTRRTSRRSKQSLDELDQLADEPLNRLFYLSTAPTFFPDRRASARRGRPGQGARLEGPCRDREAVRPRPRERPRAQPRRAGSARRGPGLPHRPLPRQGDRPEHPRVPVRELDVRADLELATTSTTCRSRPAEDLGIGTRAGYYDSAGALRDLVQNHMLQLLALLCMEPPNALRRPTRFATRRSRCCARSARRLFAEVSNMAVRGAVLAGHDRQRQRPRLPRGGGRRGRPRRPRPTPRCASRSATGAGPACRSTCARASAWPAR